MLGDDIAAALPEMRAQAESLMDLCLVAERPGEVLDSKDRKVPGFVEVGRCVGKLQGGSASSRDAAARTIKIGGVNLLVMEEGLHIPVHEFIVANVLQIVANDNSAVAWRFRVDGSRSGDCSLLGRKFQVVKVPAKSAASARRLDVVEV